MTIRMKMKQKKMRKIGIASALGLVVLVVLGLYGASNYMLNYSLNYPKEERMTAEHWKNRMKNECPWMIGWMDSVYQHHCVKDTFVVMPSGYKAHLSLCTEDYGKDCRGGAWLSGALRGNAAHRLSL